MSEGRRAAEEARDLVLWRANGVWRWLEVVGWLLSAGVVVYVLVGLGVLP